MENVEGVSVRQHWRVRLGGLGGCKSAPVQTSCYSWSLVPFHMQNDRMLCQHFSRPTSPARIV